MRYAGHKEGLAGVSERRLFFDVMPKKPDKFDFWYAVNNTEILQLPTKSLETFGSTMLNYYMISELMDVADQVRVREGRIQAFRPQIVTPTSFEDALLDGFGEEADKYINWLRDHEADLRILQYGFKIKKEEFSEEILTESAHTVADKVREAVKQKNEPFSAIVMGVDNPWEVSLIKLMTEIIRKSVPGNVKELEGRSLFGQTDGVQNSVREEIEDGFRAAQNDGKLIQGLADKLKKYGLFEKFEDRFFSLVKSKRQ